MYHSAICCCLYFFVVGWLTVAKGLGISHQIRHLRRCHRLRSPLSMVSYSWSNSVSDVIAEADETNIDYNHDEVTYRIRSGEVLHIPQAERYSTKDWLHNLATIPSSRLLKRINGVIFFNFLWSTVVYVLHNILKFESPGSRCHSLLGGALGLLLVFRTNTAYNRFWEGRKIWERLLSSLRDMGRMTVVYGDVMGNAAVSRMLLLLCVFPMVLQEHVQGFRHSDKELSAYLSKEELSEIERVTNRPFFLINKIHREVRKIPETSEFTSRERQTMQKYVDDMSKTIGASERIVQTPVPLTYARHTSRFLSLFCLTAPIALVGELGWYIIPFVTMVTWSLFGILEIGMMIEEPFQRALKLEVFANTIRRDLSDLLHVTDVCPTKLSVPSEALGYEVPFFCRMDEVCRKLDERSMTKEEVMMEITRLRSNDKVRIHRNDPFMMPDLG